MHHVLKGAYQWWVLSVAASGSSFPASMHCSIRQQVSIQVISDRSTIWLQGHAGEAGVAAIKCRMVNPSTQLFIVPQGPSYLQSKKARIGVHEPWRDASVPRMPVDQDQFSFSHLPDLLHEFHKDSAPHNVPRVISVKIDLHTATLARSQNAIGKIARSHSRIRSMSVIRRSRSLSRR